MSAIFDLQARRAARPRDRDSIIGNLCDGLSEMQSQASSWPFRHIKQKDVDGAERNLMLLRGLLAELRAFVPTDDQSGAA